MQGTRNIGVSFVQEESQYATEQIIATPTNQRTLMPRQRQTFCNATSITLEIMVEPNPDRYLLKPNEEMTIEAEYDDGQEPFAVNVYDGGLTVYPAVWPLNVWIDGILAEPDWVSPGPNAVNAAPEK